MLRSLVLPSLALAQVSSFGSISFQILAERLDDHDGFFMPSTGLVLMVVDRDRDGFMEPSPTWFTAGDDLLVRAWTMNDENGEFTTPIEVLELENNVDQDDPFKLLWFPSLTSTNTPPQVGDRYGQYEGDPAWKLHGVGLEAYSFRTADAPLGTPGISGDATFTVVPEPATYAGAFALGCLGWAVARSKMKSRRTLA